MFTPSKKYWKDLAACDAELHRSAQARAGGWCRHDAQDLWRPTPANDATTAAYALTDEPETSWHGWQIWGARSINGTLVMGEAIEPDLTVNPNAQPSILRTTFTYSFNRFPFPGGNHMELTRHSDQPPSESRRDNDMNRALMDAIDELKTGMVALHVPEEQDYQLLLSQMEIGAAGLSRVLFDEQTY